MSGARAVPVGFPDPPAPSAIPEPPEVEFARASAGHAPRRPAPCARRREMREAPLMGAADPAEMRRAAGRLGAPSGAPDRAARAAAAP